VQLTLLVLDWVQILDFLRPRTGKLGLVDYEKVFCPVADVDRDIFDLRRIDRGSGALVVVRPDQYVALTLPLDGFTELDEFFARFMTPA
jgi:phenol 2-monooxygenase